MGAETFDCDVLVVGLGPVGATLTVLLSQQGRKVIAVDRDTEVYPMPRAAHFDHEIMRLFQQMGVADAVAVHARPAPAYEFRSAQGDLLMRFDPPATSPSGWSAGYMFHQPGVENALRAVIADSALAEARLGVSLVGFAQDADGVTATLQGPGGEQAVRARYLVGCDGASSRVREALGGELDDYRFDEPWLVIDAKVGDGARVPDVNLQVCDPARPTTCVLMGPGRHRWEFMLLPGETAEQALEDRFIEPLIAAWDCGPVEIDRRAVYRFHGLVARVWRADRVLLAGDSAHQMPPFAGQGMCSGLRDAANLAWKLVAILRGEAGPDLLDTYQAEREPHVRGYIELAIGMGRTVCTLDPAAAAARDAAMLAQRAQGAKGPSLAAAPGLKSGFLAADDSAAGAQFPQPWTGGAGARRGLDDLLGPGAWLICRDAAAMRAPPGVRVVDLAAAELAPYRSVLAAWLDARNAAGVLVRPDRYVFGAGDPAALMAAHARALGVAPA